MPVTTEKKKGGRPPGLKKTGGRKKGTPNFLGSTISETFRNFLSLDDESVERTGQISSDGYRCRVRIKEMLDGERTPDPAYTGLHRVALSYAFGNPRTMDPAETRLDRRRLAFITANGLPWEQDPMYEQEQRLIKVRQREAALEAEIKGKLEAEAGSGRPASPSGTEVGEESLELVRSFDLGEGR